MNMISIFGGVIIRSGLCLLRKDTFGWKMKKYGFLIARLQSTRSHRGAAVALAYVYSSQLEYNAI